MTIALLQQLKIIFLGITSTSGPVVKRRMSDSGVLTESEIDGDDDHIRSDKFEVERYKNKIKFMHATR